MSVLAIAHRAGNSLPALEAAVAVEADVIEADVHSSRGRLEVRHSKTLGPLPWLWDRNPWELTSRSAPQLELPELLAAHRSEAMLMLDLKGAGGVGPRTVRALHAHAPDRDVIVCSRWWPSVDVFADAAWARRVLSARNRSELVRLRRRLGSGRGLPVTGVSLHGSLLSAAVVAELRERVELVMTWGVNDLGTLDRVTALGVNAVISDSDEVLAAVKTGRVDQR